MFLETPVRLDSDLRVHCRAHADSYFELGLFVPKELASGRRWQVELEASELSGRDAFVASRISQGEVE